MGRTKKNVLEVTEQESVHRTLLDLGFIYMNEGQLYVFEDRSGMQIILQKSFANSFSQAVGTIGQAFFRKDLFNDAHRKLHYRVSQALLEVSGYWFNSKQMKKASGE